MIFMNRWDVEEAVKRHNGHEVLGPATKLLNRFMDMVDENSDGWAYWRAAQKAAKRLIELIQSGDGTAEDLKKATTPLKSLCTRGGLTMVFELPEVADNTIDKCPICGGELQATMESYQDCVVINDEGDLLDYQERNIGTETRIYCVEDHTYEEIMERLNLNEDDLSSGDKLIVEMEGPEGLL
jgi:hypothetical protein